jgi:hypothetical protein
MTSYLFLDIDGVLNDRKVQESGCCGIKESMAIRLNRILREAPEVKIVVSSAWRYMVHEGSMTLKGMEYLLSIGGVMAHGRVIGVTKIDDIGESEEQNRKNQIEEWLQEKGDGITNTNYVVLDDLELNMSQQVLVNSYIGLSDQDVERAISILHENAEYLLRKEELDRRYWNECNVG